MKNIAGNKEVLTGFYWYFVAGSVLWALCRSLSLLPPAKAISKPGSAKNNAFNKDGCTNTPPGADYYNTN